MSCDGYDIFLCRAGQGGRGRGANVQTGPGADQRADKGAWVSLWVDDVDEVHQRCLAEKLEVTHPPTDEAWGVREMHVRHPDGHVFRRDGRFRCGAATVAAEVIEQVAARIRLASIVADRELVGRYAELLDVAEQPLRNLLTDAAEITEAEVTRQLPGLNSQAGYARLLAARDALSMAKYRSPLVAN